MDVATEAAQLRVLADPTRAKILRLMIESADGRVQVGSTADELGLRQPTVSHHMKALLAEGLVERTPDGRKAWYSLAPEHADRIGEIMGPQVRPVPDDAVIDRVVRDLSARYRGTFGKETVERYVRESHDLLAARPGTDRHLPSSAAQFATDRLDALSRDSVRPATDVPEVLFVCVQNAGRSQIASAILRHLGGDRVHVRTAGSQPAGQLRSSVVTALDEIGVPVAGEYPKPLTDEVVRAADVVITMGCGDACPVYPGRRYLDWQLDDPAGRPLTEVRRIRDDIEARVRSLLAELESSRLSAD